MTTVKLSEISYVLIIICLLPLNSIINPLIHSIYDIKTIFSKRKEKEDLKRKELVKFGKEQVFNKFLNFMEQSNDMGLLNISEVNNNEILTFRKLFSLKFHYVSCCCEIAKTITFCHKNNLTLGSNLNFENLIYNVKI